MASIIDTLDVCGEEEAPCPPIHHAWADKILKAWGSKQSYASIKPMHEKYKLPSNCIDVKPPKMNIEMWRLLDKWQRKSDLQFSGVQKTLTKVVAATLNLTDINMSPGTSRDVKTRSMQVALDIITMLTKAHTEISAKRKNYIRSVIKPEFKTLCTSTKVTDQLFGDTLAQDIKDCQVKRKLEKSHFTHSKSSSYRYPYGNNTSTYGNKYPGHKNSGNYFLWKARGRGYHPSRAPPHHNAPHKKL